MSEGTTLRTVLRGCEPTEGDRAVAGLHATPNALRQHAAELQERLAGATTDPAAVAEATQRAEQAEARLRELQEAHAAELARRDEQDARTAAEREAQAA